jgi:hypothetical protein
MGEILLIESIFGQAGIAWTAYSTVKSFDWRFHMTPKWLTLLMQVASMLLPALVNWLNAKSIAQNAGLTPQQQQALANMISNLASELAHHNPVAPTVPTLNVQAQSTKS